MNPLTNVRNVAKLNEQDLRNGIFDHKKTWHSQYNDSAYIFIGGLPFELTEGDILCVFSQYGEIMNINLVRDKKSGKSKGYGFICYEDQRSTILAVDNFNAIKLGGRTIRVDHVAEYRTPKGDEKGDDGKFKDKVELGCAPKTPPPIPSGDEDDDDEYKNKSEKKKKKKKDKEKKKKKKRDKHMSDDNEEMIKKPSRMEEKDFRKPSDSVKDTTDSSRFRKSDDRNSSRASGRERYSRSPSIERKARRERSTSRDGDNDRRRRRRDNSHSPVRRRNRSRSASPDRYRSNKDTHRRR